jgi:nucleoside-diphosphate-sugar epimerase
VINKDLRNVSKEDLAGCDAVAHLAELSNDPLGQNNPEVTFQINHKASVNLAKLAQSAGIRRFVYTSSCSVYGAGTGDFLDETAQTNPQTAYAECKTRVERDVGALAGPDFAPVFLRNATAYGPSPRMRFDIVLNDLSALAWTTRRIAMVSDGSPWRPLVHVEDISRAFLAALEAPREAIHNQAFNVGRNEDNLRVREIADMVKDTVPNCTIRYAEGGGPDPRCYRVDCRKIARLLPAFQPRWSVQKGVVELYDAYREHGLTSEEFLGNRYLRLKQIKKLQDEHRLDDDLRWERSGVATAGA